MSTRVPEMTAADVCAIIRAGAYRIGHEALLQMDLEKHFVARGVPYEREFRFSATERVDFFVDGHIALELKIHASRRAILRQMERYAAVERVDSLILMTAAAMGMAPRINDKPVYVVQLGRMALGV
jgi:hypothetical protein